MEEKICETTNQYIYICTYTWHIHAHVRPSGIGYGENHPCLTNTKAHNLSWFRPKKCACNEFLKVLICWIHICLRLWASVHQFPSVQASKRFNFLSWSPVRSIETATAGVILRIQYTGFGHSGMGSKSWYHGGLWIYSLKKQTASTCHVIPCYPILAFNPQMERSWRQSRMVHPSATTIK